MSEGFFTRDVNILYNQKHDTWLHDLILIAIKRILFLARIYGFTERSLSYKRKDEGTTIPPDKGSYEKKA